MSEHHAKLVWNRKSADFSYETYDRTHEVTFGGGLRVVASAAAEFLGKADLVNPEELFVAALSSCHMLTFLAIAAKSRLVVDSYHDEAVGTLAKGDKGKLCITNVVLRPKVVFSGTAPTAEKQQQMHESAHRNCFIANSVACEVTVSG